MHPPYSVLLISMATALLSETGHSAQLPSKTHTAGAVVDGVYGGVQLTSAEGRGLGGAWRRKPPAWERIFSRAAVCRNPDGTTGYCLSRTLCAGAGGSRGATCPGGRLSLTRYCCIVGRCPLEPPGVPEGATRQPASGTVWRVGSEVTYTCRGSAVFEGLDTRSVSVRCISGGNWERDNIPPCVPELTCREPPPSAEDGVDVDTSGTTGVVGSELTFTCPDNSFFRGLSTASVSVQCNTDGTWQPRTLPPCLPACQFLHLQPGVIPDGGGLITRSGEYPQAGSVVELVCEEGSEWDEGPVLLECSSQGEWLIDASISSRPECVASSP